MGTGTGMAKRAIEEDVTLNPYDIVERCCRNCHFCRDRVLQSLDKETGDVVQSTATAPQCTYNPQALTVPIRLDDRCSFLSISDKAVKRAEEKIKVLKATVRV